MPLTNTFNGAFESFTSSLNDRVHVKESVAPTLLENCAIIDFERGLPALLNHLKYGEIKKGKSHGVHFFDSGLHRIREHIKGANEQGVWEAKIDVRHPKTNAWVPKEKSSTLFPIRWSENLLKLKLFEAFQNSKQAASYKYYGKTNCGITIVFVLQNNSISSCYPVWK